MVFYLDSVKCGNSVLKNIQRTTVNSHPPHSTLFCYLAGVCSDGDSIGGVATSVKCKYYCVLTSVFLFEFTINRT